MKNLLVGNGVNIQFDKKNYSSQQICLRLLKSLDQDNFPSHVVCSEPKLVKIYIGYLFLIAREVINGEHDHFLFSDIEKKSVDFFKKRYHDKVKQLKITDICFEDYYLLQELFFRKNNISEENQLDIRGVLRLCYLFSIYNGGELNKISTYYSDEFKFYLKSFDYIFTTNYDLNIDSVVDFEVYHLHGCFNKLSPVYDKNSAINQLENAPINDLEIYDDYLYIYSNAISTYCGDYKKFEIEKYNKANSCIEKFTRGYKKNKEAREKINSWCDHKNKIISRLGQSIKLKSLDQDIFFPDEYKFKEFKRISGKLEILGLSPYNDFHIFETIDNSNIKECIYYFYDEKECFDIKLLLPNLKNMNKLIFKSVVDFWRSL